MLLAVAKSNVPPPKDSGAAEVPRAWVLAACKVPKVTVVVPV